MSNKTSDSLTSGGKHVVFAETVFDLAAGTLRHVPQPPAFTEADIWCAVRFGYSMGYEDAVRFVEARRTVAANVEAGRGE